MKEIIAQDNRLTTSRYELTLIEKRIFITSSKKFGSKYNTGQRDLFDDLILFVFLICKEVNQEDNKKKPGKPGEISSPQLHLCK
jgi:hypothetical protein